ncbi:MAG: Crp/Fnr family transcriptional regulator [Chitinophagales bacterium]
MSEILTEFLKSFEVLTSEEISLINEHTVLKSFKKGSILLKEGEVAKNCYAILKGCVRRYYIVDGEEKTTAFYTEGDPVTSFTSYNEKIPSKHFLECIEDCTLTEGTQDLEKEMCRLIPRLENIIRVEVEKEAGKTQENFALFITSSPEERYLNLLKTRPNLLQRVPQHQIASFLGIKPESLSRLKKRILTKTKS